MFKWLKSILSDDNSAKNNEVASTEVEPVEPAIKTTPFKDEAINRMTFNAKGSFLDDVQKTIKKLIKQYKEEDEYFSSNYEGLTAKEIKEEYFGEKIYQYGASSFYMGSLVDEPDNKFDTNAIKIYLVDSTGSEYFIGYVPKELCDEVKEKRSNYEYYIATGITGGKYKKAVYSDDGDEEICKGEDEYGIKISLSFWEELPLSLKENKAKSNHF
ncbi:hypothetical protein [Alkalicoccobacillus murimartini]|uniref:HIRAN domain-containing protein n=1 Tax=Alkalicoccobacillus murimartini TaxID=171685 RepID=A0ABT9YMG7_9BACI|nr:hypothetical protein [Alkalicoccobacillus murimartini]MDQ0208946.1 hypothetical protein [Alkalicoccobacillus murimartini]